MLPRDAQGKNMLHQCIFIAPPESWNFETWLIFFHHIRCKKFGFPQNLKSVDIWVSEPSSIFVRHDNNLFPLV